MNESIREVLRDRLDPWRSFVSGRADADPAAVETRLVAHVGELMSGGLGADEAFLVALTRVASDDAASREYAREYADSLLGPDATVASGPASPVGTSRGFLVMLACAAVAAIAIKVPTLFGISFEDGLDSEFYLMNITLFVLPSLLAFYAWAHRPPVRHVAAVAGISALAYALVNAYPFVTDGSTQILTAVHLPIALWLVLGVAAAGGGWLLQSKRMEYTRFTGEWFITYVLIALGGGVLTALTMGVFEAIGVDAEIFVSEWMLPAGAMAAFVVAAWLVETRRNLVGGLAPMLARVFTPLFAVMLVALLGGVIWSRGFIDVEREVLILFDLLLVVVLALVLYAISARDPREPAGIFDRVQFVLVASALAVDVFALANMAVRLGEMGTTPNRVAAIGLNLILLVNLGWSAYLQTGFLSGKRAFAEIERWQMRYLPVYAAWAGIVALVFPVLFRFA